MLFARSVRARRPKAPSRSWYSVKRRKHDVDRALPILRVGVGDVGEDAPLGSLLDEVGIGRVDEGDHGAGRLIHDLLDHMERVLGALAEADQRDVRPFTRRHCPDVLNLDLARNHLVPESGDDRRDERQAIRALVRDQNAQVLGLPGARLCLAGECYSPARGSTLAGPDRTPFSLLSLLAGSSSGGA
jgi:hypothetical protein